jgi:hypothetical protein
LLSGSTAPSRWDGTASPSLRHTFLAGNVGRSYKGMSQSKARPMTYIHPSIQKTKLYEDRAFINRNTDWESVDKTNGRMGECLPSYLVKSSVLASSGVLKWCVCCMALALERRTLVCPRTMAPFPNSQFPNHTLGRNPLRYVVTRRRAPGPGGQASNKTELLKLPPSLHASLPTYPVLSRPSSALSL